MTSEHERLVRETYAIVEARATEAAGLFYARLFSLDPSTRRLFEGVEMEQQGRKFVAMLGSIVRVLDQPPQLVGDVAALGRRHAHLHTTREQFESVGAALLWTLEQVLGDAHTPDVREAWSDAYALIAGVMQRATALRPAPESRP